jgi:hypothetical protein
VANWRNIADRIVPYLQISQIEKFSLDKNTFRVYHTFRFSKNRAIRGAVVHQSRGGAVQAAVNPRKRVRRRNANSLEGVQVGHAENIRMTVTVSGGDCGALLPDEQHFVLLYFERSWRIAMTAFILSGNSKQTGMIRRKRK